MNLRLYLSAARGRTQRLADRMGVSGSLITQWANGKAVSVERCGDVERETAGAVRRWDLRPLDWHRIWPELIGAEGAPEIPEPVTQQAIRAERKQLRQRAAHEQAVAAGGVGRELHASGPRLHLWSRVCAWAWTGRASWWSARTASPRCWWTKAKRPE